MSVIRVNKTKDFTVMSNHHFKDRRLTLKAKGLLSQMLSLPDNWDYTVSGLVSINKEKKSAIQAMLKELEECGYLVRTRTQNQRGQFDYIYDIYEESLSYLDDVEGEPWHGEPRTENPVTDNPCTENQPQYNTKEYNTKELNIKNKINKKESRSKYGEYNNVLLSESELDKLKVEFPHDWEKRIEAVSEYCESSGKKYKNYLATIRNWARRDAEKIRKPLSREEEEYIKLSTEDDLPF